MQFQSKNRVLTIVLAVVLPAGAIYSLAAYYFSSGYGDTPPERTTTIRSPDGKYQAFVVDASGGAWSSTMYLVYVARSGERPLGSDKVLTVSNERPEVGWRTPRWMVLTCDNAGSNASVESFKNNFYDHDDLSQEIRIELRCGQDGYLDQGR